MVLFAFIFRVMHIPASLSNPAANVLLLLLYTRGGRFAQAPYSMTLDVAISADCATRRNIFRIMRAAFAIFMPYFAQSAILVALPGENFCCPGTVLKPE